ncbi:hypothetical protein ACLESD_02590 [Pyxidicoccus sp. 3LFB2]
MSAKFATPSKRNRHLLYAPAHTMVASQPIERDVGVQAKGARLQRLRACELILEGFADDIEQAYSAVEVSGDVFLSKSGKTSTDNYTEEDKNYADTNFTLLSQEVINSLVIFIDIWIQWRYSTKITFGFYTTANIGKEQRNSAKAKALGVTLPAKPLLEYLSAQDFSDSNVLPAVKSFVLDEYETQYKSKKHKGNLAELQGWSDQDWMSFLGLVHWRFDQEDHAAVEQRVLKAIKQCPQYNQRHVGREHVILALLLELFDKKQGLADPAQRFVHKSDVALVFRDVAVGDAKLPDPTWEMWSKLPAPTDQRHIKDKLLAACPTVKDMTVTRLARRVAASQYEQKAFEHDKGLLALKYHIYETCIELLDQHLAETDELSEEEVKQRLSSLTQAAVHQLQSKSADYKYPLSNSPSIENLILELFDSCFLAFNGR